MVYFIDEDYRKLKVLVTELKFRGLSSEVIRDADSAYHRLWNVSLEHIDLVIIDVMLSAKASGASRYSREKTDDYHKTGLVLLDDLVLANPDVFPKKAVFLTNASSDALYAQVKASAKDYKIECLRKSSFETAFQFGAKITEIVNERR